MEAIKVWDQTSQVRQAFSAAIPDSSSMDSGVIPRLAEGPRGPSKLQVSFLDLRKGPGVLQKDPGLV